MINKLPIRTLVIAALWFGVLLLLDFASTVGHVYPQFNYGQSIIASILILATVVFFLILVAFRLDQKRYSEAGVLFLLPLLFVAFAYLLGGKGTDWKFRVHKPEYLSALAADSSPSPKFHVFNWEEDASGFLSASHDEAIVYDETDEIARKPGARSVEWIARRSPLLPGDGPDTWGSSANPRCDHSVKSLGEHFYHVTVTC